MTIIKNKSEDNICAAMKVRIPSMQLTLVQEEKRGVKLERNALAEVYSHNKVSLTLFSFSLDKYLQ